MTLMRTVVVACLLAFEVHHSLLVHASGRNESLLRREDLPPCGSCLLPSQEELNLGALFVFVYRLRDFPFIHFAITRLLQIVFETAFNNTDKLKEFIDQAVTGAELHAQLHMELLIDSLENITYCPQFPKILHNLQKNVEQYVPSFSQSWQTFITDVDPASRFVALAQAVQANIPQGLKAIKDGLFNSLQAFATDECDSLSPILFDILDTNGALSAALSNAFVISGNKTTDLFNRWAGILLPGGDLGGPSISIALTNVVCGAMRELKLINEDVRENRFFLEICSKAQLQPTFAEIVENILCNFMDTIGVFNENCLCYS